MICSRLLRSGESFFLCWVLVLLLVTACARRPEPYIPTPPQIKAPVEKLQPVTWQDLPGWMDDDMQPALSAFITSCPSLRKHPEWLAACQEAQEVDLQDGLAVRNFFQSRFIPHRLNNPDGTDRGLITGYYVPDLMGSRTPTERFRYPILGVPDDLLVIDLGALHPDLKGRRLRGRLDGRRVVPYWSRAEIDAGQAPLEGKELFWVEDPVELFFLHIQGSGRISLPDGERIMVNYADQNGHPYRSIGKLLLESGALTRDQMSLQNIKAWGKQHPEQVKRLLGENPSYVFFASAGEDLTSPPGALGYPLTPERSLAIDPSAIPLGAPVFIATTWPYSSQPLQRLMVAQDTGGAIKGTVRADFFWGLGNEAGARAGRMKQEGRLWVLLPRSDQTATTELSSAADSSFQGRNRP